MVSIQSLFGRVYGKGGAAENLSQGHLRFLHVQISYGYVGNQVCNSQGQIELPMPKESPQQTLVIRFGLARTRPRRKQDSAHPTNQHRERLTKVIHKLQGGHPGSFAALGFPPPLVPQDSGIKSTTPRAKVSLGLEAEGCWCLQILGCFPSGLIPLA